MLDILIFSKNRAAQLNMLLSSIRSNFPVRDIDNIFIIHTYTDIKFRDGYFKLMGKGFRKCVFLTINEKFFRGEVIYFLETIQNKYTLIITDDSVVYRKIRFSIKDIDDIFTDDVLNFSFRLGLNTYKDSKMPELERIKCSHFIKWNWKKIYGKYKYSHFNFPFYMDGMMMKREELLQLISSTGWGSMRSLEACTADYLSQNAKKHYMLSPFASVIVTSPNNMVADDGYLPNGLVYPYSVKELNEKYLNNINIDFDKSVKITSVMQELPFVFTENKR